MELGQSPYGRLFYKGESLLGLPHGRHGDLLLELGATGKILPLYSGGWDGGLWSGVGQEWLYNFELNERGGVDFRLHETFQGRFKLGRRQGNGTLWRPKQELQLEGCFSAGQLKGLACIRRPTLGLAYFGQVSKGVPNGFGELQCGDFAAYTLWKDGTLVRRAAPSEALPALQRQSAARRPFSVSQAVSRSSSAGGGSGMLQHWDIRLDGHGNLIASHRASTKFTPGTPVESANDAERLLREVLARPELPGSRKGGLPRERKRRGFLCKKRSSTSMGATGNPSTPIPSTARSNSIEGVPGSRPEEIVDLLDDAIASYERCRISGAPESQLNHRRIELEIVVLSALKNGFARQKPELKSALRILNENTVNLPGGARQSETSVLTGCLKADA